MFEPDRRTNQLLGHRQQDDLEFYNTTALRPASIRLTLWNEEAGVLIDVDTNMPEWDGEIPQYAFIAEVMSDLATRRSRAAD